MAKHLLKNKTPNLHLSKLLSTSPESKPRTSLYAYKGKSDGTKYRIPLLHDNEQQLFYATESDQWKFGIRSKAPRYREKAALMDIYPDTNIQPIENFNYKQFDKRQQSAIKQFSEFSDFIPHHQLAGISLAKSASINLIKNALKRQSNADVYNSFSGKGWTHTTPRGESFGPPRRMLENGKLDVDYDTRFNSKILQVQFRESLFSKGKQSGMRITVAVGNGKGLLGVGMTFHPLMKDGLIEAKQFAYAQLVHFPMTEESSIPYPIRGRYHRTELYAQPIKSYQENRAQRVVKELLDLAGYKNVGVKLYGRNTVESIIKAFFVTFQNFETPQQQADNLGRYVVQFDPANYFMPKVLAAPKDDSNPVPFSAELPESSQRLK